MTDKAVIEFFRKRHMTAEVKSTPRGRRWSVTPAKQIFNFTVDVKEFMKP